MSDEADRLRPHLHDHHIAAQGNAVVICGYITGHSVRPIAFCENRAWAEVMVEALKDSLAATVEKKRRA